MHPVHPRRSFVVARFRWSLVLVLVAYLAGLSVVLAYQNRDLRESNADLALQSRVAQAVMYVPGFRFLAMEGAELALGDPPSGRSLPSCWRCGAPGSPTTRRDSRARRTAADRGRGSG
jgi:hypothetical protein